MFVRKEEETTEVDLSASIDFAEKMVKHYFTEKNISFEKKIKEPCVIRGNSGQVQQLLLNLLLNSIDSIDKDEGIITIAAEKESTSGTVVMKVTDNGCGIPEQDTDSVFDLFFTTKEGGKGTGLGLSIVHSIVTNHNGTIEIESRENEGTDVIITFPVKERE
jgi:signal transduction histidine kinase